MGDPRRSRKKYNTPGHPYQKERFEAELVLVGKYGLRNKKEIWRARTKLGTYRKQARELLALDPEEREKRGKIILDKLIKLGILNEGATTDDILALDVEDFLKRRLQTRVYELGLAKTIYHARQLITHRHVMYDGHIINAPGFLVPVDKEHTIQYAPNSPYNDPNHPMAVTGHAPREEEVTAEE